MISKKTLSPFSSSMPLCFGPWWGIGQTSLPSMLVYRKKRFTTSGNMDVVIDQIFNSPHFPHRSTTAAHRSIGIPGKLHKSIRGIFRKGSEQSPRSNPMVVERECLGQSPVRGCFNGSIADLSKRRIARSNYISMRSVVVETKI